MMDLAPNWKRLAGVALLALAVLPARGVEAADTHAGRTRAAEAKTQTQTQTKAETETEEVAPTANAPTPGRAAVWRAIFARPAAPPQGAADDPAKIALGYDLSPYMLLLLMQC